MRNFKIITILLLLISATQIFSQTSDLEAKTNKAKADYSRLNNNEKNPICVINGVVLDYDANVLSTINPDDIESMEVLKDKNATEKYGEKGKNGVIIIKLKNADNKKVNKLIKQNENQKFDENQYKIKITGIITDAQNNTITGAVITNLTKKEAYYSDFDGKYEINVAKNDVLNFSCFGCESQKIEINNQSTLNIVLNKTSVDYKNEIIIKKPVIYLYPTTKTDINFSFNFKGKLLTTFPKYEKNWQLIAYPDGKIFDKKTTRFYSSLFWDGTQTFSDEHYKYKSGFVVSKDDLTDFLVEKLESIGLNNFETNDFIQYWLPILEKNETNFIHFYTNSEYDVFSTNDVNPKPDTSIRVFMEFYPLENKIEIPEQKLYKTARKGFTLIEWGGSNVAEPVNNLKRIKL